MADPKEIMVKMTLQEDMSKKLVDLGASLRNVGKEMRSSLMPVGEFRYAWMKVSLIWGATAGTMIRAMQDASKEMTNLDKASVKLGTTTEELSRKIYGFNIATQNARIGAGQMLVASESLRSLWIGTGAVGLKAVGSFATTYRAANLQNPNPLSGSTTPSNRFSFLETLKDTALSVLLGALPAPLRKTLSLEFDPNKDSKKTPAAQQLLAESKAVWLKSPEGRKEMDTIYDQTQKMSMSKTAYEKSVRNQNAENWRTAGIPESNISTYLAAAEKQASEDRMLIINKSNAQRLTAEGNTLDALKLDQQNALTEFKRSWGDDGKAVKSFQDGQNAMYDAAYRSFYGMKSNFQILHDGWISTVSAMTDGFSNIFYSTITGQVKDLKQVFVGFGQSILKVLSDMAAQAMVTKAIAGWKTIFPDPDVNQATFYHTGGIIRAHTGLAIDEVPIVAQTGEGVLSRRGMKALGTSNFDALNSGKPLGETVINNYTININAIEPATFADYCAQHPEGIKAVVAQEHRLNGRSVRN